MDSVRFHRLAAKEYRSARNWYRTRDPSVGDRFRAAVNVAIDRITNDADSYAILVDDVRWIRIQRFPYALVFVREETNSILVLAVAHAKRRPEYWNRRR